MWKKANLIDKTVCELVHSDSVCMSFFVFDTLQWKLPFNASAFVIIWVSLMKMFCRLRRSYVTNERNTTALRLPVGDNGLQNIGTCRPTVFRQSYQPGGKRWNQRREDVVQSQREVTVSAKSQVAESFPAVHERSGQMWTATCPQLHHRRTRLVDTFHVIQFRKENESY